MDFFDTDADAQLRRRHTSITAINVDDFRAESPPFLASSDDDSDDEEDAILRPFNSSNLNSIQIDTHRLALSDLLDPSSAADVNRVAAAHRSIVSARGGGDEAAARWTTTDGESTTDSQLLGLRRRGSPVAREMSAGLSATGRHESLTPAQVPRPVHNRIYASRSLSSDASSSEVSLALPAGAIDMSASSTTTSSSVKRSFDEAAFDPASHNASPSSSAAPNDVNERGEGSSSAVARRTFASAADNVARRVRLANRSSSRYKRQRSGRGDHLEVDEDIPHDLSFSSSLAPSSPSQPAPSSSSVPRDSSPILSRFPPALAIPGGAASTSFQLDSQQDETSSLGRGIRAISQDNHDFAASVLNSPPFLRASSFTDVLASRSTSPAPVAPAATASAWSSAVAVPSASRDAAYSTQLTGRRDRERDLGDASASASSSLRMDATPEWRVAAGELDRRLAQLQSEIRSTSQQLAQWRRGHEETGDDRRAREEPARLQNHPQEQTQQRFTPTRRPPLPRHGDASDRQVQYEAAELLTDAEDMLQHQRVRLTMAAQDFAPSTQDRELHQSQRRARSMRERATPVGHLPSRTSASGDGDATGWPGQSALDQLQRRAMTFRETAASLGLSSPRQGVGRDDGATALHPSARHSSFFETAPLEHNSAASLAASRARRRQALGILQQRHPSRRLSEANAATHRDVRLELDDDRQAPSLSSSLSSTSSASSLLRRYDAILPVPRLPSLRARSPLNLPFTDLADASDRSIVGRESVLPTSLDAVQQSDDDESIVWPPARERASRTDLIRGASNPTTMTRATAPSLVSQSATSRFLRPMHLSPSSSSTTASSGGHTSRSPPSRGVTGRLRPYLFGDDSDHQASSPARDQPVQRHRAAGVSASSSAVEAGTWHGQSVAEHFAQGEREAAATSENLAGVSRRMSPSRISSFSGRVRSSTSQASIQGSSSSRSPTERVRPSFFGSDASEYGSDDERSAYVSRSVGSSVSGRRNSNASSNSALARYGSMFSRTAPDMTARRTTAAAADAAGPGSIDYWRNATQTEDRPRPRLLDPMASPFSPADRRASRERRPRLADGLRFDGGHSRDSTSMTANTNGPRPSASLSGSSRYGVLVDGFAGFSSSATSSSAATESSLRPATSEREHIADLHSRRLASLGRGYAAARRRVADERLEDTIEYRRDAGPSRGGENSNGGYDFLSQVNRHTFDLFSPDELFGLVGRRNISTASTSTSTTSHLATDPANYIDDALFSNRHTYEQLLQLTSMLGDVKPKGTEKSIVEALKVFTFGQAKRAASAASSREDFVKVAANGGESASSTQTEPVKVDVKGKGKACDPPSEAVGIDEPLDACTAGGATGVAPSYDVSTHCPICLDEYADADLLAESFCGRHCFHEACLKHWLGEAKSCPMCREEAPTAAKARGADGNDDAAAAAAAVQGPRTRWQGARAAWAEREAAPPGSSRARRAERQWLAATTMGYGEL